MTRKATKSNPAEEPFTVRVFIPLAMNRKKSPRQQIDQASTAAEHGIAHGEVNPKLVQAIARAFYWQRLLDTGQVKSGSEIARLERLHPSTVNELLRLTLLDPKRVMEILQGKQPPNLSMLWFTRNSVPSLWQNQNPLGAPHRTSKELQKHQATERDEFLVISEGGLNYRQSRTDIKGQHMGARDEHARTHK